jgi:hypothetical protein
VHVFVSNDLVNENMLWLSIDLIYDTWVSGIRLIIFEELESHTFIFFEDFVRKDFLGRLIGVKELDLGLGAGDVMSHIVFVIFETILNTFDGFVDLTNVASRSSSELSEVVDQTLKVVIEIIRVFDHLIKRMDLVIKLFLGKILLSLLLLDLLLLVLFPLLKILDLLGNGLLLLILLLDLGLHEKPLGKVVHWV